MRKLIAVLLCMLITVSVLPLAVVTAEDEVQTLAEEAPASVEAAVIEAADEPETAESPESGEEIAAEAVSEDEKETEVSDIPEKETEVCVPAAETGAEPIVLELTGDVDVRMDADGMSAIIASLPEGAEVTVLSVEGDWAAVTVDGQPGYIFVGDLEGLTDLTDGTEEAEEQPAEPVMKVLVFSSRRAVMHYGETVFLTCLLEGFDGYELSFQWECDIHDGNGFRPVPGATGDMYSFSATAESLSWDWRLTVTYN